MRVLFAAGGTGGHLSPALNLVEAIGHDEPDSRAVFLTSGRKVESSFLDRRPVESVSLFPREGARPSPFNPLPWLSAVRKARRLIRETRPSAVVATGGYVTLPVAAAAALSGLPLYLLEQNAVPGRATRVAAPLARRIFCHYEGAALKLGRHAAATGSPLSGNMATGTDRTVVEEARRFFGLARSTRTLLVAGGSLGARSLNSLVIGSLPTFGDEHQILHITGSADHDKVRKYYQIHGDPAGVKILPFCDRMDLAYRASDLILCRAGGMTVAEICAVGLPSILIPYPHHRDGHQYHNAALIGASGAGIVVQEKEAAESGILRLARELLDDGERLERMGAAARELAKPAAAGEILAAIRNDLSSRRGTRGAAAKKTAGSEGAA
jgi:UDP-N-acetylglucosamine--N-acetylmuramyl-(pentapeptide) pyrophosphoryl-undecaprenol N-acetylglucosamine transferase